MVAMIIMKTLRRGCIALPALLLMAASAPQVIAQQPAPDTGSKSTQALPAGSVPAYVAEVQDPQFPQLRRRVELHWVRSLTPAGAGTDNVLPVLWEPDSQCMTPLRKPQRLTAAHWMMVADGDAGTPANADCRPMRRIGDLVGIDNIHIWLEARREKIQYSIRLTPRRTGNAAPPVHTGDLRPSKAIAALQGGRFEEKSLVESGIRSLNGIYLVTNFGIFKGTDRAASTGKGGFTVVQATDLNRKFATGELYWSASTGPSARSITFAQRLRFGDGRSCRDIDDEAFSLDLRFLALHKDVRTWSAEERAPAGNKKFCAAVKLNVTRCKVMNCVQWSDTLTTVSGEHGWFLTDSERNAREIYARLPKWTVANRGYKTDNSSRKSRDSHPLPWGECGLEGCDARRRREAIDSLLVDLWNR